MTSDRSAHGASAEDRGLDEHGSIRREGDASRVQEEFRPLVAELVAAVRETFDPVVLDGVYLYGSVPRGTAWAGRSDLDAQVLLRREPLDDDHDVVRRIESRLARAHPEVIGVGILLHARDRMLDPARRHDEGFHVRVLCTPVWGRDAGALVAPHLPDVALAREVQGDWRSAFDRLRRRGDVVTEADAPGYCRAVGRRLTRVAFTWALPRWGGWTSDPRVMAAVVARYEPTWEDAVRSAVELGWEQRVDVPLARTLLDGLADTLLERGEALGA